MPGLVAAVFPRAPGQSSLVHDLLVRAGGVTPMELSTANNGLDVGMGVAALAPLERHASFSEGAHAAVIDGEIHDAHLERVRLERAGTRFQGESHAELLLRGYHAEGAGFLERLHGAFSAVVWNGLEATLAVITDRFGMRPVYMGRPAGAFVVASSVPAVLSAPGLDAGWDEDGIAQFFAFGHFMGTSTPHRGVRALPAAACGTYRVADDSYREERYWTARPGVQITRLDDAVAALDAALVRAVNRRAAPGDRLGLSLSGGLDARTILALMPAGVDLHTVSLGIEGSLDHRSSTALAALAGVPHRNYVLDAAFLARFEQHLGDMVRLTGGQYLDQGIVMPTMGVYQELGIEFLHRGHGGELLHMKKAYAYSLDSEALGASEPALEDWLFARLTGYMLAGVPDDLFSVDVRGRARESLRLALARTSPVTRPVDRVWQLFLNERLHRETALSMQMFNHFVTVRMPFIDSDVVGVLLSMPAEMKLDETLQASLLGRHRPDFLQVTNANTGAVVGAGRLTRELGYLRMRVAAKLGFKGYQPYERLGLWLRRELRDLVTSTLLDEQFLDGGLFRPDAVRRVVGAHLDHGANHTFMLMALLIFGMGREGNRQVRQAEEACRP